MSKVKIKLVRSTIGSKKDQIATVQALGLKKLNHEVTVEDNACIQGMIFKVKHLIKVEQA